jgi:hypothetical protein
MWSAGFQALEFPAKDGLLELSEKRICKHLPLHESGMKVRENSGLPLATILAHRGLQE